jgi:hypothetical protein
MVNFLKERFEELKEHLATIQSGEMLFGLNKSEFPLLVKKQAHLTYLKTLYNLYDKVIEYVNNCYEMPWSKINTEKITQDIFGFQIEYVTIKYLCQRCRSNSSS